LPKVSVSVPKSLLEEARVGREEVAVMAKELLVKWARLRGRLEEKRRIIASLTERIIKGIGGVEGALVVRGDGSVDYMGCLYRGLLMRMGDVLSSAEVLLELLKDTETVESGKLMYGVLQDRVRRLREDVEFLHALVMGLASGGFKDSAKGLAEAMFAHVIADTVALASATACASLSLMKLLREGEELAARMEGELQRVLKELEKKSGRIGGAGPSTRM